MEIQSWETPIGNGDIFIINLVWGCRDWYVEYPDGLRYEVSTPGLTADDLKVQIFHSKTETLYEMYCESPGAYRMLDEHGLMEIWSSDKILPNTFKVSSHGWSNESPLSFFHHSKDGWSYIIATDGECLEVVTRLEPQFRELKKVKPRPAL